VISDKVFKRTVLTALSAFSAGSLLTIQSNRSDDW